MRPFLLLLPLLLVSPAKACLNDRDSDSLAIQAVQFPDTLRVITGRFERNPPLFYQMRIRRSLAELKKTPRNFALYDDIAVAFDKLHRDDEALRIMEKKRALLPPFDAKNLAMKEAWYRYFANAGTFRAHRYLSAKSGDLAEMKVARGMIKRAIEIKPNAHFGREKYQLMAMDWIVATRQRHTKISLSDFLIRRENREDNEAVVVGAGAMQATTKGLSGLIVLGAAWESADIFHALASSLNTKNGITLSHLALLRTQELLKQGRKSLSPTVVNLTTVKNDLREGRSLNYEAGINEQNQKTLAEVFPKLRAEAEDWNTRRQNYMIARMERGDHPDTNPLFWADWKPTAPPSLQVEWFNQREKTVQFIHRSVLVVKGVFVALIAAIGGVFIWLFRRSTRRRAA